MDIVWHLDDGVDGPKDGFRKGICEKRYADGGKQSCRAYSKTNMNPGKRYLSKVGGANGTVRMAQSCL